MRWNVYDVFCIPRDSGSQSGGQRVG